MRISLGILAFLQSALSPLLIAQQPAAPATSTRYLFAYFVDEKDGLHLASSNDGLKWKAFMDGPTEKIFLKPRANELMRDPCLLLGPDQVFRLVWTTSWESGSIGYASSKDLLHWSEPQEIPVMKAEPKVRNTWAPVIRYDQATRHYLVFWASTIPGLFPATDGTCENNYNHRIYLTTTTDFTIYTPTVLFFDPKFSVIDATVLPFQDKFYLIFKNETLTPVAAKNLYLSTSDKMMGPYENMSGPIATQPPQWVEGPTAIQMGDKVIMYYDCYRDGHFGASQSSDMQNWTDITPKLSLPNGIRHGLVIAVPDSVAANLTSACANLGSSTPSP